MTAHEPMQKRIKRCSDEYLGGAWTRKLLLVIKQKFRITLGKGVGELIFSFSSGSWEPCSECQESVDPQFDHQMIYLGVITTFCENCDPWRGPKHELYTFESD